MADTTYLTTGEDAFVASVIAGLVGLGYPFNPLTTSLNSYLASTLTSLGTSASPLTSSRAQLLSGLLSALSVGTFSYLTVPELQLWSNLSVGLSGPIIQLSSATIADTASVGDTVGTLSVTGGTGSYTFTLTSNPGTLFSITTTSLKVAASLTAGSDSISIKADNGAGSTVTQPFLITVMHTGSVALKADLSDANGNEAWVFW